ncbi:MAG: hypothetical protein ABGY11_13790 [Candidatus Thioglobus sp.]
MISRTVTRSIRATLNDIGVILHDPILEPDSLVELLDIMYSNVADNRWVIIITGREDYLATVEYFKTVQSMVHMQLKPDGSNYFRGPMGEEILMERKIDRERGRLRMNYVTRR